MPKCNSRKEGRDPHSHKSGPHAIFRGRRMQMETFITSVQSVGFPIAVAVAMFVMLQGEQKQHKEESQQIRDAVTDLKIEFSDAIHKMESQTTEAINNNTLVIQKLLDKLEEDK